MKRRPLASYVPPALLCWGVACGPSENISSGESLNICGLCDDSVPDIVVEPEEVDFGTVLPSVLLGPAEEEIAVCNVGESDLHIQNIEVLAEAVGITPVQSVLVPPEQCTSFSVLFDPLPGEEVEAWVDIVTDDPDTPVAQVHVEGAGGDRLCGSRM